MHNRFLGWLTGIIVMSTVFAGAADFKDVKLNLSRSDCIHFEFLSTIDSKIFDVVDSADGDAYIAQDGRYCIEVGADLYLFDGDSLYTYIPENNQVIIEKPDSAGLVADEISFVMKLDEWYDSQSLKQKNRYRLVKKKGIEGDMPDSMIITVDEKSPNIKQIEYLDINGDLNRIEILKQESDTTCDNYKFKPHFPDSVERIRI